MFERFSRSYQLVKLSAAVLRENKRLVVFPLLSSIAAILVFASFLPVFVTGIESGLQQPGNPDPGDTYSAQVDPGFVASFRPAQFVEGQGPGVRPAPSGLSASGTDWLIVGAFYLVEYFVIVFFNTALVAAALAYMRGEQPTVLGGLGVALGRFGAIFGYAVIAATVGLLLRVIEERVGFIGRIVVSLLGVAWTVATFLTLPVLVSRDVGPVAAVKQSASLLKQTWGENLIANAGIGLFFVLVYVGLFALFGGVASLVPWENGQLLLGLLGLFVLALLVAGLVQFTMQGIFSAALYHHATGDPEGDRPPALSTDALTRAFITKG